MRTQRSSILMIDACDYEGFPVGGALTTARQMLDHFGNRFAVVGVTTDDTPIGRWTTRVIGGREFDYFSVARVDPGVRKPVLPRRLTAWLAITRHRRAILSMGATSAFVFAPEVIIAIQGWGLPVAYTFCGVSNPLSSPRYPAGRLIARQFDACMFRALAGHAQLILAAADRAAIEAMRERSAGLLADREIVFFPSMYDARIFNPSSTARQRGAPLLACCGRLNASKGWDLVLDAFSLVRNEVPEARLCFIGDGEDRQVVEARCRKMGLSGAVTITGFIPPAGVARHLNEASVLMVGSHREGWPTAVVEAEACGLPVVMTRVSGAGQLVDAGKNGYVIDGRDAGEFSRGVLRALDLECPNPVSLSLAAEYSIERQLARIAALWLPLQGA